MAHVIEVVKPGGLDQLRYVERELGPLKQDAVQIKQLCAGVNFVDIYHREGIYKLPKYPGVLGVEGVGVIEKVGDKVKDLNVGDRVAYFYPNAGAYATERTLPAARCVKVDPSLGDAVCATLLVRSLAAVLLVGRVYNVTRGTKVLVQSAAGGLGTLLVQACRRAGAKVVGTVGHNNKIRAAKDAGAETVVLRQGDWATQVKEALEGGADVAYDGIGGDTVLETVKCVREGGTLATFGRSEGPADAHKIDPVAKAAKVTVAYPSIMKEYADDVAYQRDVQVVMRVALTGLVPHIGKSYPLSQAAKAQEDLESGKSLGALVLRTQG